MKPEYLRTFLRAILGDWLAKMSGAASVPAAIAATYVEGPLPKILLSLTMFACAWFAAYRVWAVEHDKVAAERNQEEIQRILSELFDETRRLLDADITPDYPERQWCEEVAALLETVRVSLAGKVSDLEIKALLAGEAGPSLSFRGRGSKRQDQTQNFLYYFHQRLSRMIDRKSGGPSAH